MKKPFSLIFTVLTVQSHTASIGEQADSDYYNIPVPQHDYLMCRVEVPCDYPYLSWGLKPDMAEIAGILSDHDDRMLEEHGASAYLWTVGVPIAVFRVETGRGETAVWESECYDPMTGDHIRPAITSLWMTPFSQPSYKAALTHSKEYDDLIICQEDEEVKES